MSSPHDPLNVISAMCWDGRHALCTGWLIHSSDRPKLGYMLSATCECTVCRHEPVAPDRHLHEPPQKGAAWNT